MVTANLDREQRSNSVGRNEDDENDNRSVRNRLDRLYLDNPHTSHVYPQYSHRTHSPYNSRELCMPTNTVPIYRHGRKFYVSAEEFERMRAEERRYRRVLLQKSQNLPVPKSHQTNFRQPSSSSYNPAHRSAYNPHDHRYGVLRSPHLPTHATLQDSHNQHASNRQSRSIFRYYDDREDALLRASPAITKLPTSSVRSNSSDKVLDSRRTPQPLSSFYGDYATDDHELKRSFSAELVQPPQVLPRRAIPTPTCDFSMSTASPYPPATTDQSYSQSNTSKPANYYSEMQLPIVSSPVKLSPSDFSETKPIRTTNTSDLHQTYSVRASSNRCTRLGLTSVFPRSSPNHTNNDCYLEEAINESFSDDNSSSPSMKIQRPASDSNRSRRNQLRAETDTDFDLPGTSCTRSTVRSQSSDRVTEKKRVRFADMEGFTLEIVPNDERSRLPTNNHSSAIQQSDSLVNDLRRSEQHLHHAYYPIMSMRVGDGGSQLATDV